MNRGSPLGKGFDLHQWPGRVDVFDGGAEVGSAVRLAMNLQQVGTHIDQVSGRRVVDGRSVLIFINPAMEQVHVSQKIVDEGSNRTMINLVWAPHLLDAAFIHHRDTVRNLQRLILIVSDEHAGNMNLVMQLPQPAA